MEARRPTGLMVALVFALTVVGSGPRPVAALTTTDLGQAYDVRATLDVAAAQLDAVSELELTNRSRWPIDHVNLSLVPRALGFATVDAVMVDGEEVEQEWTTSINLRVPLDDLPRDASATVNVAFRLDVGLATPAFTARTSAENGVLSFGQWFPIASTEHEVYGLGDSQHSFTADRIRLELTTTTALPRDAVACPGLVTAPETTGTEWVCDVERVRDLSFVVNPRFRLVSREADGVQIRAYAETVDPARTADLAAQALAGMEETFGDYPWGDLVLAEVGSASGFSMEYPRQVHLTRDKVADTYVVFHEVAHQWFYAQLGNDQQAEPWVDEAWADFSARLLMGIGENACGTHPVDSSVFAWEADAVTGGDWTSCDGYFHSVFYRGTEFITAVRSAMGDEAFFAAMRAWLEKHRHDVVTGDELLLHLERATDADLGPIFAGYLADPDPRPFGDAIAAAAASVTAGIAAAP